MSRALLGKRRRFRPTICSIRSQPNGDVNDYAGLLSPAEKEALEARCRQLRETGAQLAIVTLKSLRGGEIDDFANKLFARWGVGQKDKKNGLLLVVAMDDANRGSKSATASSRSFPTCWRHAFWTINCGPAFASSNTPRACRPRPKSLVELVERGEPADREALAAEQGEDGTWIVVVFLTAFVVAGSFIAGVGLGSRVVPALLFGLLFAGVPMAIAMGMAWPVAPLSKCHSRY